MPRTQLDTARDCASFLGRGRFLRSFSGLLLEVEELFEELLEELLEELVSSFILCSFVSPPLRQYTNFGLSRFGAAAATL